MEAILATGSVSGVLLGEPSAELRANKAVSEVRLFTPFQWQSPYEHRRSGLGWCTEWGNGLRPEHRDGAGVHPPVMISARAAAFAWSV